MGPSIRSIKSGCSSLVSSVGVESSVFAAVAVVVDSIFIVVAAAAIFVLEREAAAIARWLRID
jgi:hypothetical protein